MKRAFAPGHVSGAFAVHDEASDALARGSRGMGWSTTLGATARVSAPGTSRPERVASVIRIQGVQSDAPVTQLALHHLAPGQAFDVDLQLALPMGQGFGMSAAGTLAACLAAAAELELEPEDALAAAHRAEVESGTGLGDAVGSYFGAGEIRIRAGCPPQGWAMRIEAPAQTEFLYCVLGESIPTPRVIRDATWKAKTRRFGDAAVDRLLAAGREQAWPTLLAESQRFSLELGLMPDAMRKIGEALTESLRWGQCMLGNTLWVTGPADLLQATREDLARVGPVLHCGVDEHGARVLR